MEPLPKRGLFWRAKRTIKNLKTYNKIAHIDEIVRRYFLMNSFDGIMTILGIVLGSMFSGGENPRFVISVGIGAAIAMAVSGIWGAYIAEHAERLRELVELEKATLRDLRNTTIARAFRTASIIVAAVDGISPLLASLAILTPFFIAKLSIKTMYVISVTTAFLILLLLGLFIGRISKESTVKSIIRMLFAGIVCAIISALLV